MSGDPEIRPATAREAAAIAGLLGQLGYPASPGQVLARLERVAADPACEAFVAVRGGTVVGCLGLQLGLSFVVDGPVARVITLVVDEAARGRGLGARLMEAAERWARERGADQVQLTTSVAREHAHRFYEDLGYQRTGWRFVRRLEPEPPSP